MTILTAVQIARVAKAAGFSGEGLVNAVSVALAESGGNSTARCYNTDKHKSVDRGLWQINNYWHKEWNDAQCDDPATCAKAAFEISSKGTNWKPWSTWNNGAAARHHDAATRAVADLGTTTTPVVHTTPVVTTTKEPALSLSTFKGVRDDARTVAMLNEVDHLTPKIPFRPVQGGYNKGGVKASAGTHDRAAVDISVASLSGAQIAEVVRLMRMVGFAAWYRRPNWDHRGGGPHVHAVPVGGDLSSGARAQVQAYFNGQNGLASHGKDDGPRQYVGVTWEKYLASKGHHASAPAPAKAKPRQWFGPRPRAVLVVDGVFGKVSVKALQEYLSSYIPNDGIWGPTTCKKVQEWLRVKQDGVFGPVTHRALCAKIGLHPVPANGWVLARHGDLTSIALQKYLNAHR